MVSGGRAEVAVVSFQRFAADPWFDCFSIAHRGEGVAQRIQLGSCLGCGLVVCGRDLVNRSQGSRRSGRVGFGSSKVMISPLIRRAPHGRGGAPCSGAWGTSIAVGKCPCPWGNGGCGSESSQERSVGTEVDGFSERAETGWRCGQT